VTTVRRVYTFGWDGPPPSGEEDEPTFVFTGGWFGQSYDIPLIEPLDPSIVAHEQKITGQLTTFFAQGTGSTISPGTRGVESGDARVGEVVL